MPSLTLNDFTEGHKFGLSGFRRKIVTVTSAEILALFATPKTLVPAPGAGNILVFDEIKIQHVAAVAYAGIAAGEDLQVKYENAAGMAISEVIETTGFLDQTVNKTAYARRLAAAAGTLLVPTVNKALVLHLLVAEIITGTGTLKCDVRYRIEPEQVR